MRYAISDCSVALPSQCAVGFCCASATWIRYRYDLYGSAIELVFYLIWLNENPLAHDEKVSNNPQLLVASNFLRTQRTPTTLFKYSTQFFLDSFLFFFPFSFFFYTFLTARISFIQSLILSLRNSRFNFTENARIHWWCRCCCWTHKYIHIHTHTLKQAHTLCVCVYVMKWRYMVYVYFCSIEHRNPISHRNAATQQTHFLHVYFIRSVKENYKFFFHFFVVVWFDSFTVSFFFAPQPFSRGEKIL